MNPMVSMLLKLISANPTGSIALINQLVAMLAADPSLLKGLAAQLPPKWQAVVVDHPQSVLTLLQTLVTGVERDPALLAAILGAMS